MYLSYITRPDKVKEIFAVNKFKIRSADQAIFLLMEHYINLLTLRDNCRYKIPNKAIEKVTKIIAKELAKTYKLKTVPCSKELFKYLSENDLTEFDSYQGKGYCGWDWKIKNNKAILVATRNRTKGQPGIIF